MDKKTNKVKAFMKEHKKGIAVTVGTAVVGGVIFAVTKHKPDVVKAVEYLKPENIEIPKELIKYGVDNIDNYTGAVELTTGYAPDYKVAVAELGRFGEALCKIPDIKPENKAFVLINIAKEIEDN